MDNTRRRQNSGGSGSRKHPRRSAEKFLGKFDIPPDDPKPSSHLDELLGDTFQLHCPQTTSKAILVSARSLNKEKIREIGRGRYGTVDIMREPISGLEMAVKRIRETEECQDPRYLEREVRACLRAGECPFLVMCYGIMRSEGDVWICMELMDSSLDRFYRTAFDSNMVIPDLMLARIAHSSLSGLLFMAKVLHLMHRDVKPSNMLISRTGQVKLCDYGIVGVVESQPMSKTIQAGCKPYMAPERIDFNHPAYQKYDERSDVWSLGISLIEIAKGSHPYDKWKSPFEQLKQVVHQPAPLDKLHTGNGCSERVIKFITTCLDKDYESRPKYQSMLETDLIIWYLNEMDNGVVAEETIRSFVAQILDVQSANESLVLNRQMTGALKLT